MFLFLDTWETAPNEQNWKRDCICHYRTDNVCIGSCLMQPKRLRPMEQKCCMRRGANAAYSQALPGPASSQLWGLEVGTGSEEAAGGSRTQLASPVPWPGGLWQAAGSQTAIPAAQSCTPSSPPSSLSAQLISSNPSTIHRVTTSPLLIPLSWSPPGPTLHPPWPFRLGAPWDKQHLITCTYKVHPCSNYHNQW